MKCILFLFIPCILHGQSLKPGTYHNLKPTSALVLDSGEFIFIGLEMKGLDSPVWLDATKAKSIRLEDCTFSDIRCGIALKVSGNATISGCQFIGVQKEASRLNAANAFTAQRTELRNDANFVANNALEGGGTFGIVANSVPFAITNATTFEGLAGVFENSEPRVGMTSNILQNLEGSTFKNLDYGYFTEGTGSLSITGNTFENNTYSIYLNSGEIDLELRCNVFKTDDAVERTGLQIGESASINQNVIGGDGEEPNPLPNANVWPWVWVGTAPNQTKESPTSWTSASKPDNGGLLDYFKFTNEFIGEVSPNSGTNRIRVPVVRLGEESRFNAGDISIVLDIR